VPIPPGPPRAFAPLFRAERSRLLATLRSLAPADWARPTRCPGWTVLGLATHLVGVDVGLLAGRRDGHHGTPAPPGLDEAGFVRWLDAEQAAWVHAARRLSPRLAVDLLAWADDQVADLVAAEDAGAVTAGVSWASAGPVPVWLDHARELSERWIHRQQVLDALGAPPDLRPDLFAPVLDGLRWAYPHRLAEHPRPPGTAVVVTVTGPLATAWTLVADGRAWSFTADGASAAGPPAATLTMTSDQAWRLLTNNLEQAAHGTPEVAGDPDLVATLLRTRAIIGTPQ
jgi:uncharacterized protein (TIGR03083 family)